VTTRRALLRAAAAGGLGGALARAPDARAVSAALRAGVREVAALEHLIVREDAAHEAYALAAERTGDALLARLRDHDAAHAAALRTEIEALTVGWGPPRPGVALHDPDAAPLASARRPATARAAAIAMEGALLGTYTQTAAAFVDGLVLQTVASVAAAHAQQLVALRLAAGRAPLDESDATRA
jgi:hypothetical protein